MLYSQVVNAWWPTYAPQLLDTTRRSRKYTVDGYLLPAFGDWQCEDITSSAIQERISAWGQDGSRAHPGKGLSPIAIIELVKPLRLSLAYAVREGIISKSPADGLTLPRIIQPDIITLSDDEVDALIDFACTAWFADAVDLAHRTGMRRGEIAGLMWQDINLNGAYLLVRRSIAPASKGIVIHPPKTKASRRRIDLDARSVQLLMKRREQSKSLYVFPAAGYSEDRPVSPHTLSRHMASSCSLAGIPRHRFHDLRHTHATWLLSRGINPKVVQERLGHADVATTLGTYGHVLPSMQQAVVALLNSACGPLGPQVP